MPDVPEWDAGVAGVVKRTIGGLVVVELAENNRMPEWPDVYFAFRPACRTMPDDAGRVPDVCRTYAGWCRTFRPASSGIIRHLAVVSTPLEFLCFHLMLVSIRLYHLSYKCIVCARYKMI